MKTQRDQSLEQVLIFSVGESIRVFDPRDSSVISIGSRPSYVQSLTLHNGQVLDAGKYGISNTATGNLFNPFLKSQSFKQIAGVRGELYGLQFDGNFRNLTNPNKVPELELEEVRGLVGGETLTYWGENNIEPEEYSAHIQNTFLNELLENGEINRRYEHMISENDGCTDYEGFLGSCVSLKGNRYVTKRSGEIFSDEGVIHGHMKRVGLAKSEQLLLFKKGMKICRRYISGRGTSNDWSKKDEIKREGWEKFLDEIYKYKDKFSRSVWEIQDIENYSWPYKFTSKIPFKPLSYEDAYKYFESELGYNCRRHAEFHRSQGKGYWEGGAIDYAIEMVLGNMIKDATKRHIPTSIAHLDDSVYLGTQSGRIIKISDSIKEEERTFYSEEDDYYGSYKVRKPFYNFDSLLRNPNEGYFVGFSYEYPAGWAEGKDIDVQSQSKRKKPINSMLTLTVEEFENTGIHQRINQLRKNRFYFANGRGQEQGLILPIKKVA